MGPGSSGFLAERDQLFMVSSIVDKPRAATTASANSALATSLLRQTMRGLRRRAARRCVRCWRRVRCDDRLVRPDRATLPRALLGGQTLGCHAERNRLPLRWFRYCLRGDGRRFDCGCRRVPARAALLRTRGTRHRQDHRKEKPGELGGWMPHGWMHLSFILSRRVRDAMRAARRAGWSAQTAAESTGFRPTAR